MHRIDTTTAHTSVREAFANCIIHCAYTVMGNITVDRYFNKIVLSNPGTMLVSKEEFEEGGHSVCRKLYFPEKGCHLGTNRSDNET